MTTGIARHTATTQRFLDACPAVRSWCEVAGGWLHFDFDAAVPVPVVPPGVYFDAGSMDAGERADYEQALANANVERLRAAIKLLGRRYGRLPGNEGLDDELAALEEILDAEGFGGREDHATTEDAAGAVITERLAWLRDQRAEEVR